MLFYKLSYRFSISESKRLHQLHVCSQIVDITKCWETLVIIQFLTHSNLSQVLQAYSSLAEIHNIAIGMRFLVAWVDQRFHDTVFSESNILNLL